VISIEAAKSETDFRAVYGLVKALAIHENTAQFFKNTEAEFVAGALAEEPRFSALLGKHNDKIVGMATYLRRFHIWNNSDILILDDLFVSPEARGLGVGTRLLKALGDKAKTENIPVKWQVQADNHDAIALYKRMGADFHTTGICWWRPENIS